MTHHYAPSPTDRRIVRVLASERISHRRIAAAVRASVATLRRAYAADLFTGTARAADREFFEAPIQWPEFESADVPAIGDEVFASLAADTITDPFQERDEAQAERAVARERLALIEADLVKAKATIKRLRERSKQQARPRPECTTADAHEEQQDGASSSRKETAPRGPSRAVARRRGRLQE